MDASDQHFFVVGPIEDADAAALGKLTGCAPEKVVLQLGDTRMLEAEYLATLRIDSGHDVLDCPIFSCCVHALKNEQHRDFVFCIQQLLQVA